MDGGNSAPTSPTLLGRLSRVPADQDAWAQFAERYGRKIYGWCRHWHLQEADAEEVTQEVLLKLVRQMAKFRYDPTRSFRAWLKTVTHHAWRDFLESRRPPAIGSSDTQVVEQLQTIRARDDLADCLDAEFARELMEEAMTRVQLRVRPHTWEAFHLVALEKKSSADVGKQLGMKVAAVYVARSKVQKMLREEVRRLQGTDG